MSLENFITYVEGLIPYAKKEQKSGPIRSEMAGLVRGLKLCLDEVRPMRTKREVTLTKIKIEEVLRKAEEALI